ncbi:MAG: helix-turn-helix domain-containing protein, partial [Anaerolineae bacterium]
MADELLNVRQLQELLGVDRVTIYRLLDSGELPGFKVGGQWRFSRAEIEAWLARQRAGGAADRQPWRSAAPCGVESLPLSCMEPVQDIFAQAVGVSVLSVDPAGKPLTPISNPCA